MGTDRRAYESEWRSQPGPIGTDAPISDPLVSIGRRGIPHDTGGRATPLVSQCFGRIIEFTPYLNCYRVAIENGAVIQCVAMSHQSNLPWGPSSSDVYGPGQDVLITLRSSLSYGVILGAVPPIVSNPNDWRPDSIFSGSNVGFFLDGTSNYWNGSQANDLTDFSAGRPYDSTASPEVVSQGVTGVGHYHDDYGAGIKADEETGLFVMYDDSMTRLAGRNLQVRASGLEEEHLNDEGELDSYKGRTPYPWEAMGAYQVGVKTFGSVFDQNQDNSDGESPSETPEIEGIRHGFEQPLHYDQQPFHRIVEYGGYLGQGGRKMILAPGKDVEGQESEILNTYAQDLKWAQMQAEQSSLAGRKVTVASGDMLFIKRPPPPAPKRKERPESALGDRGDVIDAPNGNYPKNYDPCGLPSRDEFEEGDPSFAHYVTDDLALKDESNPNPLVKLDVPEEVLKASLIADEIAYAVAWEGVHPFHYHSRDFYLPQESDLGEFNKSAMPPYPSLNDHQFLGQAEDSEYPEHISVKVDHRYDEVKIYLNTAVFGLKKDGSFVLRTGCGCEVKSENGTLELAAPGDIVLRPGRNTVVMSGKDTIIKSRNSMDMSTSEGDIRAQAATNLMMASAVENEGVMLLQSFSTCVLDPERENAIQAEKDGDDDSDDVTEDLQAAATANKNNTVYFLGEEVVGSGILFKAVKSQITANSQEATVKVGRKKYDDEDKPTEFDPNPVDENGDEEKRHWVWKPGKIRLYAEFGQIESMGTYIIDYVNDVGGFSSEGFDDAPKDNFSGAIVQAFLARKNKPTDNPNIPVVPGYLPPNILAAAGTADMSGNNSCSEKTSDVCYQVMSVNEFRADRSTICADLLVDKELFVGGCAYIRGNLTVFDHIEANFETVTADGGLNNQRQDVVAVFDEADTRCIQLLPSLMAKWVGVFTSTVDGSWLDYSNRTMKQYGTKDKFAMLETWWQHQIRIEAEKKANDNPDPDNPPPNPGTPEQDFNFFPDLPKGTVYWNETYTVSHYANNIKTSPYPGIDYVHYNDTREDPDTEPRLAKRAYGVYDLSLVDEENGRPKDRNKVSENGGTLPDGLTPLLIYEDVKLSRGALREFNHYIAIGTDKSQEEDVDNQEPAQ